MARGGEVLAPGPPDLPLQYIDARDLAQWLLDAGRDGLSGPFNVVSRRGHTTMGALLDSCRSVTGGRAQVTWVDPELVEAAGIEPWSDRDPRARADRRSDGRRSRRSTPHGRG
jgi:nucleoside-diphosphate-sugar epimerase